MIYCPPAHRNCLWTSWIIADRGVYYLFSLCRDQPRMMWDTIRLATSMDLVHWTDRGPILRKNPEAEWLGGGHTWRAGSKFYMGFSECYENLQIQRFAESPDLRSWTVLAADFHPDPQWYQNNLNDCTIDDPRWDGIYVVADEQTNGYRAFFSATTNYGPPARRGVVGMALSQDGITWEAEAPCIVPGLTSALEFGSVARLGERWYMTLSLPQCQLGQRHEWPDDGLGTQFLVADKQIGPYLLPGEASNRLISSRNGGTYNARFFVHEGKVLLQHVSIPTDRHDAISLAPLKEVRVVIGGQIACYYWAGNNVLKGNLLNLDPEALIPFNPGTFDACEWNATRAMVTAEARQCCGLMAWDLGDNSQCGILVEVRVAVTGTESGAGGIFLGYDVVRGYGVHIGLDGYLEMGELSRWGGGWCFREKYREPLPEKAHGAANLRLMARGSFLEVYVDDRLVNSICMGHRFQYFGFLAEECRATFSHLSIWQMELKPLPSMG